MATRLLTLVPLALIPLALVGVTLAAAREEAPPGSGACDIDPGFWAEAPEWAGDPRFWASPPAWPGDPGFTPGADDSALPGRCAERGGAIRVDGAPDDAVAVAIAPAPRPALPASEPSPVPNAGPEVGRVPTRPEPTATPD